MDIEAITDKPVGEKALPHTYYIAVNVEDGDEPKKDGEILYYVFCVLLSAMGYRQDTIVNDAKKLQQKADLAEVWETREEQLKFPTITQFKGDPTQEEAYLRQIMLETNNVQDQKNYCQNVVLTIRQSTQVITTQSNSDVSSLTQMCSMNSAFVQMLYTIAQLINQKMH